jgi:hypothetical protein
MNTTNRWIYIYHILPVQNCQCYYSTLSRNELAWYCRNLYRTTSYSFYHRPYQKQNCCHWNLITYIRVEQELLTLLEHLSSPPVFSGVRVTRSLVLYACFVDRCLYFFFWPLCWLFVFDLRILINPLVSSNSSYIIWLSNLFLTMAVRGEGYSSNASCALN